MKKQYSTPATQAQSMIATQVFMTSPTGLEKGGNVGGDSEHTIRIE